MKKPYLFLSVLLLASLGITAGAQTDGTSDAPQAPTVRGTRKKVVRYNDATNEVVEVAPQENAPVYIVNSPKYESAPQAQRMAVVQQAVQEQPSTLIEASSLKESKADQLRKSRQDMEVQTEQKIVEKLEEARIQDEKARADRLFGASLAAPTPTPTPAPTPIQFAPPPQAPQAQQQPPVVIVEKQEVVSEEPVDNSASIKDEVKKQLDEAKVDQEPKSTYYIGGLVGVSEYPDASNVRGTGSGGVTVGTATADGWVAEGTFMYSTYDLEVVNPYTSGNPYPPFKGVAQYNFEVGAKYQFLSGKLRPTVGVLASYDYRKYQDKQYVYVSSDSANTNALDVGLTAGLDLMITKTFSLGIDFKYFMNVAYNTNADYQQSFTNNQFRQPGTPLEKLDYYTATLAGKVTF